MILADSFLILTLFSFPKFYVVSKALALLYNHDSFTHFSFLSNFHFFLLDTVQYRRHKYTLKNVINPCLSSQFALLETVLTALYDTFPSTRNQKFKLTALLCVSCFLMGIPMCATVSIPAFDPTLAGRTFQLMTR